MICVYKISFSTGDFLRADNPVYEDIDNFTSLKKFMEEKLEDYNMEPGIVGMNLVLFRDAIEHGKGERNNTQMYLSIKEPYVKGTSF